MKIFISGRVQGVGFRPFIHNLANKYSIVGWVRNIGASVEIEAYAPQEFLDAFLDEIRNNPPPLSRIASLDIIDKSTETDAACGVSFKSIPDNNGGGFVIKESLPEIGKKIVVSPDIGLCADCERELLDKNDHRYRYPFINCTNCGPRFTIIKTIPYDRANTTMKMFAMCEDCRREYDAPDNRRFHAQPNACGICGPALRFISSEDIKNKSGASFNDFKDALSSPLNAAAAYLKEGKIIAIKSLGGYHLACDASNNDAVIRLRGRKIRESKPFAVMADNLETVRQLCEVSNEEEALLLSPEKPIVLLFKRKNIDLAKKISPAVAPDNPFLGIMLPYTPLHRLLFADGVGALVMTSGNKSQEPIYFKDDEAFDGLADIADAFLTHNRPIERRCDDSIVRIFDGRPQLIRRARGYAPESLPLPFDCGEIIGVGAELKSTFCISQNNTAFVSHHLGDLENMETLRSFEEGIRDYKDIFRLDFKYAAHDMHPDYLSTKYAASLPEEIVKIVVQHHHAHAAACMAEHGLTGDAVGVVFDGTGFGEDGTIWGGEFLICNYSDYKRVAHLAPFKLPGGEKAIEEPWRLAALFIDEVFEDDREREKIRRALLTDEERGKWEFISNASRMGIHSPATSSAGRLFDAASAVLGIRRRVDYEGEAAIHLEYRAWQSGINESVKFPVEKINGAFVISPKELMRLLIESAARRPDSKVISDLARIFHNSVASAIKDTVVLLAGEYGLKSVVLSGGCFQNLLLLGMAQNLLVEAGFNVYTNRFLPPNDGCISYGQVAVASAKVLLK